MKNPENIGIAVRAYGRSPLRYCAIMVFICFLLMYEMVWAQEPAGRGEQPFAPTNRDAVPADESSFDTQAVMETYVINPLDRLMIVVYAGEKQIEEFEKYVQSDGTVYLPFVEQDVVLGDMMILDAQRKLEKLAQKYIKEPRIVITVMSSYSQTVSTYGKIANRNIELNAPMRILQLIARAGGPNEDALEDSIRVISKDGSIKYFNYRKVNKNPTPEENFLLKPGDIVYVPGIKDFSVIVFGEVRNSGVYEMERGEKLLDALVKAGSWGTQADIKNVRILRVRDRRYPLVLHVNLKDIFDKGNVKLNYDLREGDMIYVPLSRSPIMLQYWATFFGMVQSIVYIFTLYQATR